MNQNELVRTIANLTSLPKVVVSEVLITAGDVIAETLAEGDEAVSVPHMGKFKAVRRALRRMVLPNGQERTVGGKRVGKFCPESRFRARVNGEV